jgi:hypothetical protein
MEPPGVQDVSGEPQLIKNFGELPSQTIRRS